MSCSPDLSSKKAGIVCKLAIDGKAGDGPCIATRSGASEFFLDAPDLPARGFICDSANGVYCSFATTKCEPTQSPGDRCLMTELGSCGANGQCVYGKCGVGEAPPPRLDTALSLVCAK